jgi:hypothetical protein
VLAQHLRDSRRQRRLAVIDVSDGPDVHVRFAAIKFFFCHGPSLLSALSFLPSAFGFLLSAFCLLLSEFT